VSVAFNQTTFAPISLERGERAIATAYNESGEQYVAYADGDLNKLYEFDGQYAFGDSRTWARIDDMLFTLRATGCRIIRILDLGCGPGTWLRRVVLRARELGFLNITARGTDIADEQICRARAMAQDLAAISGISLTFDVADIREKLPEETNSVDLCLCLYGVLNHVPADSLETVLTEIGRVTRGQFMATVRSSGSTPTIYVDSVERARHFHQDNRLDRMDVELDNGNQISFHSHLFSSSELRSLASYHFEIDDICGLDLFHGRFAADTRWNPPNATGTCLLSKELDRLESRYCRDPEFIDHATHLMLVARHQTKRSSS
jgi:SAM-dependent methyltransferase